MARNTRRRRDSKSKSRFRPRPVSGRAISEKISGERKYKVDKTEKIHLPTLFALICIFIFSIFLRTAWTLEPATDDGFQLTGGSDPYYHKRVVDYVVENGEHLQRDPMLNYPYGAGNARPPLFDWSLAIMGLLISPFFSSTEESVWWAMEIMPAIYGAMIIFPVYAIGKSQFGKGAGLMGAFLIGVNSGHVSHSSLALADHDSYIILFATTAFFFFMRALMISNDRKWIADWTDWNSIKDGISRFVKGERLALGYAGLCGITMTMISLSWKGFPYLMAIIVIYLGLQMLINAFRRIDNLTTCAIGLVALAMPVLLSFPYYYEMGFIATWWEAPAYILLGYFLVSLLMTTTRDLPWLLVIGTSLVLAIFSYLLLTYVFTDLGFLLFSGQGYFVRTKLFNTIAEAQAPEFADFVFAFGPVSVWLGVFGIIWMAYQLLNQNIWKKDYLFVMTWALVAIYMAQSAVRFIFNATPVVSLISGWIVWLLLDWANFPEIIKAWKTYWGKRGDLFFWLMLASVAIGLWLFFAVSIVVGILSTLIMLSLVLVIGHMDAHGEDQYRFRDRLSGLRKSFEIKRPIIALFIGLFVFLPNTFYGYDAGIPFEDKKQHDVALFEFLSYDFLRPEEYDYTQRSNVSIYPNGVDGMYNTTNNQLWYMGNTGPSFPQDYWIDGLSWLAEQDTNLEPEERPAFLSWWDYGFWAIDIGEHPTVADNFQFGYQLAGNFIASQSEKEAMTLLLYRLLEPEVNRDTDVFKPEIRIILAEYLSEENITKLEHIISNPTNYIPKNEDGSNKDVNARNAAIRAGKPILMNLDQTEVSDVIWEVEKETGNSIRYFAVDTRLMPYSADNTGILYAPVTLADYNINDFFEIQAVLSNGETVSFDEAIDIIESSPDVSVTSQTLTYKEKFLNSMFFRSFIGWSAPDIGRDIEDGIPYISGPIGQDSSLPILPGWNLTHFKLVHSNSGLRILKYYDGAVLYGTVATPNGDPVANANITVLDEARVPHATATTDKNGKYRIIAPAGNLSVAVSLGMPDSDIEKVFKSSNNILLNKQNVIVTEDQALRRTDAYEINLDLEIEASSISGRLYWDLDKDDDFGSGDDVIPLIPVTASNIRSEVENIVNTDSNGNYEFTGLAPGEYKITADFRGHTVELGSYTGTSALKAKQDITIAGALRPNTIWGKLFEDNEFETKDVTVSLYDITNSTRLEQKISTADSFVGDCNGAEEAKSFCFDYLLPGNYTLKLESGDIYTSWINNTIEVSLDGGEIQGQNASLRNGIRLEGVLSHNGNGIPNKQISIQSVDGFYGDNFQTTDNGYFATIVPDGIYNLYTVDATDQTNLAYLNQIDSRTYSGLIDAKMGPGYVVKGILFGDENKNNQFDSENGKEIGYNSEEIIFESEHGTHSVTSSFGGEYEIILPEGYYNTYSLIRDENTGQVWSALSGIEINRNKENVNLSAVLGFDVSINLFENHIGSEMIPLSGFLELKSKSDTDKIKLWINAPTQIVGLPTDDYDVSIEKFGYHKNNLFDSPEENHKTMESLSLNQNKEMWVELERNPVNVVGEFTYEDEAVSEANITFSLVYRPEYQVYSTVKEDGSFEISLAPELYTYSIILEEEGSRYSAEGELNIPIGEVEISMGEIKSDLKYLLSGVTTLNDEGKSGQVVLRPLNDLYNVTTIQSSSSSGFSEYIVPNNYYVTFQDEEDGERICFGDFLTIDNAKTFDINLEEGGGIAGNIKSQADDSLIDDHSIQIKFLSDDNDVLFIENSVDGLFGASTYGRFDLPKGGYQIIVEEEGYQTFTKNIDIIDFSEQLYDEIILIPKTVNFTLTLNYRNATGEIVPLADTTVLFNPTDSDAPSFSNKTNKEGLIVISDMVPMDYQLTVDETKKEGAELFSLVSNINVEAGNENQTLKKEATWEVRIMGTVFYDRDFDGVADTNELLGGSHLEIWNVDGSRIKSDVLIDDDGSYEIFMATGAYKTWFYSNEETSYVSIDSLELYGDIQLNASLARGVNYNVDFLSAGTNESIGFKEIDITGENFSFEINLVDDGINAVMPAGTYNFSATSEDLAGSDDYIYILDKTINITNSMDGIQQTELITRDLMRGIEISIDKEKEDIPLGQTAIFTFNVTGIGILEGTSFETNIDNIPANWTAVFEPKSFIAEKDDNFEIKLNITPEEGVVPDVFNDFNIDISWTDSKNNDIDDINHKFSLRVTPIERPKPDFIIDDFTWTPVAPLAGSELIFTAVIDDSVNKSGSHFVPVVFYVDDEAIGLTTAILNGSGEKITVTATWKAKEGSHSFQVKIDPENSIDEKSIDNNEGELFIVSVAAKEVDDNNSTLKIAATVVVFMVAGLAYISYRSRRS